MMSFSFFNLIVISMGCALYLIHRRDTKRKLQAKDAIYQDCIQLFSKVEIKKELVHYPKLYGQYAGYDIQVELIEDALSMRKVPPLWMLLKVEGQHSTMGTLDVLARPDNTEFYSPSWQWERHFLPPPAWPQHASYKFNDILAPIDFLEDSVPDLFKDARIKELLITPKVVRITYLVKQANRGEYLLMRNATFETSPIDKSEMESILHAAINIRQMLEGSVINTVKESQCLTIH